MNKLEVLMFITEQTKDPMLALKACQDWDVYINNLHDQTIPLSAVDAALDSAEPVRLTVEVPAKVLPVAKVKIGKSRFTKKDLFPNSGRHWDQKALEKAVAGLVFGLSYEEIGVQIGRSPVAVRDKHACGELPGAPKYQPNEMRQLAGRLGVLARKQIVTQAAKTRNLL